MLCCAFRATDWDYFVRFCAEHIVFAKNRKLYSKSLVGGEQQTRCFWQVSKLTSISVTDECPLWLGEGDWDRDLLEARFWVPQVCTAHGMYHTYTPLLGSVTLIMEKKTTELFSIPKPCSESNFLTSFGNPNVVAKCFVHLNTEVTAKSWWWHGSPHIYCWVALWTLWTSETNWNLVIRIVAHCKMLLAGVLFFARCVTVLQRCWVMHMQAESARIPGLANFYVVGNRHLRFVTGYTLESALWGQQGRWQTSFESTNTN